MKNKYYFFKRLYKDFVIIFIDKDNNMRSYEVDNMLLKYINTYLSLFKYVLKI